MPRALTSDELELLRSDGQGTKLYLAVLNPNTVYTARLSSVPSSTDNVHTIGFTSGSGTLSDIKPGMTLYVGTSSGAHDLGMVRIRKAPIAGTFYIGLTSQIDWQSNAYLTVVDDFDLWAKHAVIDDNALKMDVDVAYSDQHASFNPVPVLGPHAVAKLEGDTVDVQFGPPEGEESWVFGSTIDSYQWDIPDAIAIDDDTAIRPIVTFDTTGSHVAYCTVTADNGKSTTGVRKAFIWNDENPPATVFQLSQAVADYETGGWMFDVTMQAEASLSEIRDRSLVVLFAEDWYGGVKQSIGPIEGRENIVCIGRIVGQSIRWDRETGQVHFTVQGFHYWLNKIKGFPIQIQPATVAASWSQLPLMTVDSVLWHLLYWHSTVIETMDFYPPNDTRYTAEGMSMASSVWGQLADISFSKIMASPGVDRFGRLFIEVDPQMVPEADRDWPTVTALTDDDWVEGIDLQRVTVEDCSLIRLTTQLVNESGNGITLYSLSPGHTPRRYGEPEMLDRILAASQSESNSLAGLVLGWRTNEFPDVPVILAMNNRMFDLWPRQFAALQMQEEDNPRAVSYDGNLIPRRIALYFDPDIGYMHPELNFEGETFEQLSTDGDIPGVDMDDLTLPPILSLPSLDLPDIPLDIPGGIDSSEDGPVRVLMHDPNKGFLLSENFNEASPDWITVNAGLTEAQYQGASWFCVCPNGAFYAARLINTGASDFFIARAPFVGGTFTVLYSRTLNPTLGLRAIGHNPLVSEQVAFVFGQADEKFYIGAGGSFAAGAAIDTGVNFEAGLTYGLGSWLYTRYDHYYRISSGGSVLSSGTVTDLSYLDEFGPPLHINHLRASTTGITFHGKAGAHKIIIGANNLATTTEIGDANFANGNPKEGLGMDPTGMLMMGRYDTGKRGKSFDQGAAWSGLPSLPFTTGYCFAYAGQSGSGAAASRWIAAYSVVRYSPDGGNTWENKEGNLSTIVPLPLIDMVKVLEY